MPVTSTYAYATGRYGAFAYAGRHPAVLTPSQDDLGVPFLMGNDRYQVIVCSDSGTSGDIPGWRYWYAGGAPWGEAIALDLNNPAFYTTDEMGDPVLGQIEFPFKEVKTNQNVQVSGVLVEFTPQPQSLDPTEATVSVGFSLRVEGYGLPDFEDAVSTQKTGVARSDTVSFSESITLEPDDPWPNVRTKFMPIRLGVRLRSVRAVITDLSLAEINRITILGTITTQRNP